MGTLTERVRKNGSKAYMAQISIMREGRIVLRENKTFDRKPGARAWIEKREAELAKPGAIAAARAAPTSATLGDAIKKYVETSKRPLGTTKLQVLESIRRMDIAERQCADITSQDIIAFATKLGEEMKPEREGRAPELQRTPQTVGNYMSHLAAVFAIARPAWGYALDQRAMDDAMKVARRLGLVSKSKERDRRPTLQELDALLNHFVAIRRRRSDSNPMHAICAFAIFSTRRQEEIIRIAWSHLDEAHSRIWVRDMKNPGEKVGNDVMCDLPAEALRIIKAMPRVAPEIFPYSTDAISAGFTRACKLLAIDDLHFHDLRHDGVSRLFEMGATIPQAASVSGHRAWSSLKRYAHLRQTGDKYAGWPWLDRIAPTG
jgi:integrase